MSGLSMLIYSMNHGRFRTRMIAHLPLLHRSGINALACLTILQHLCCLLKEYYQVRFSIKLHIFSQFFECSCIVNRMECFVFDLSYQQHIMLRCGCTIATGSLTYVNRCIICQLMQIATGEKYIILFFLFH